MSPLGMDRTSEYEQAAQRVTAGQGIVPILTPPARIRDPRVVVVDAEYLVH